MREPTQATPFQAATSEMQRVLAGLTPVFSQIATTLRVMAEANIAALRRVYEASLPYRRAFYGGNGTDAYDPLWQSAVCSAWLHESCPDTDGSLQCTCTCHH